MEHSQYFIALRKLFEKLPGIGPRQANRFIWALLDFVPGDQTKFGSLILDLPNQMRRCAVCFRVFPIREKETVCSFCTPQTLRDKTKLYNGLYHVIGGPLDPLEEENIVRNRIKALYERVAAPNTISEIILALSPTKMGEFTAEYIKKVLEPLLGGETAKLKITRLGRGLSTGIELEYADELTLKQALDNRK